MDHIEPIRSYEELQNTVALGLDLWVLNDFEINIPNLAEWRLKWRLKEPRITEGKHGPMLGTNLIKPSYLICWGIKDAPRNPPEPVKESFLLFHTKEDALLWRSSQSRT